MTSAMATQFFVIPQSFVVETQKIGIFWYSWSDFAVSPRADSEAAEGVIFWDAVRNGW